MEELPRERIGIYALRYPSSKIVQIGSAGAESISESFYSRIKNRHRSGSEGEHHKASAAFNVGRMYRHLNRFKKTPTSKLRWQPVYGAVLGLQQTTRSAEVAKKLRNEVISRSVQATWFSVERIGPVALFGASLKKLEEEVQTLYGTVNLAWYGTAEPIDEPIELVNKVVLDFKACGRWGTGPKSLTILGDEEELLETQSAIWRAATSVGK